jgi:ELWxxDGT repeat protein
MSPIRAKRGTRVIPLAGRPGEERACFDAPAVAAGRLYFANYDPAHGTELWVTDGTAEGTRLAADVSVGNASSSPSSIVQAGSMLYFVARDASFGPEVWALPLGPRRIAAR